MAKTNKTNKTPQKIRNARPTTLPRSKAVTPKHHHVKHTLPRIWSRLKKVVQKLYPLCRRAVKGRKGLVHRRLDQKARKVRALQRPKKTLKATRTRRPKSRKVAHAVLAISRRYLPWNLEKQLARTFKRQTPQTFTALPRPSLEKAEINITLRPSLPRLEHQVYWTPSETLTALAKDTHLRAARRRPRLKVLQKAVPRKMGRKAFFLAKLKKSRLLRSPQLDKAIKNILPTQTLAYRASRLVKKLRSRHAPLTKLLRHATRSWKQASLRTPAYQARLKRIHTYFDHLRGYKVQYLPKRWAHLKPRRTLRAPLPHPARLPEPPKPLSRAQLLLRTIRNNRFNYTAMAPFYAYRQAQRTKKVMPRLKTPLRVRSARYWKSMAKRALVHQRLGLESTLRANLRRLPPRKLFREELPRELTFAPVPPLVPTVLLPDTREPQPQPLPPVRNHRRDLRRRYQYSHRNRALAAELPLPTAATTVTQLLSSVTPSVPSRRLNVIFQPQAALLTIPVNEFMAAQPIDSQTSPNELLARLMISPLASEGQWDIVSESVEEEEEGKEEKEEFWKPQTGSQTLALRPPEPFAAAQPTGLYYDMGLKMFRANVKGVNYFYQSERGLFQRFDEETYRRFLRWVHLVKNPPSGPMETNRHTGQVFWTRPATSFVHTAVGWRRRDADSVTAFWTQGEAAVDTLRLEGASLVNNQTLKQTIYSAPVIPMDEMDLAYGEFDAPEPYLTDFYSYEPSMDRYVLRAPEDRRDITEKEFLSYVAYKAKAGRWETPWHQLCHHFYFDPVRQWYLYWAEEPTDVAWDNWYFKYILNRKRLPRRQQIRIHWEPSSQQFVRCQLYYELTRFAMRDRHRFEKVDYDIIPFLEQKKDQRIRYLDSEGRYVYLRPAMRFAYTDEAMGWRPHPDTQLPGRARYLAGEVYDPTIDARQIDAQTYRRQLELAHLREFLQELLPANPLPLPLPTHHLREEVELPRVSPTPISYRPLPVVRPPFHTQKLLPQLPRRRSARFRKEYWKSVFYLSNFLPVDRRPPAELSHSLHPRERSPLKILQAFPPTKMERTTRKSKNVRSAVHFRKRSRTPALTRLSARAKLKALRRQRRLLRKFWRGLMRLNKNPNASRVLRAGTAFSVHLPQRARKRRLRTTYHYPALPAARVLSAQTSAAARGLNLFAHSRARTHRLRSSKMVSKPVKHNLLRRLVALARSHPWTALPHDEVVDAAKEIEATPLSDPDFDAFVRTADATSKGVPAMPKEYADRWDFKPFWPRYTRLGKWDRTWREWYEYHWVIDFPAPELPEHLSAEEETTAKGKAYRLLHYRGPASTLKYDDFGSRWQNWDQAPRITEYTMVPAYQDAKTSIVAHMTKETFLQARENWAQQGWIFPSERRNPVLNKRVLAKLEQLFEYGIALEEEKMDQNIMVQQVPTAPDRYQVHLPARTAEFWAIAYEEFRTENKFWRTVKMTSNREHPVRVFVTNPLTDKEEPAKRWEYREPYGWPSIPWRFQRRGAHNAYVFYPNELKAVAWLQGMISGRALYRTPLRPQVRYQWPRDDKRNYPFQAFRRSIALRPGQYVRRIKHGRRTLNLNNRLYTSYFGFKNFDQLRRAVRNQAQPKAHENGFSHRLKGLDNRLGIIAYHLDLAPTVDWARELVRLGVIWVNGQKVSDPYFAVPTGATLHFNFALINSMRQAFHHDNNSKPSAPRTGRRNSLFGRRVQTNFDIQHRIATVIYKGPASVDDLLPGDRLSRWVRYMWLGAWH